MKRKQDLIRKIISVSATSAVLVAATPAIAIESVPTSKEVEVIVIYKNENGKEKVLSVAKEIVTEFSVISAITVVVDESQIHKLKADPNIRSVDRNVKVETEDAPGTFELADSVSVSGTAEQAANWGFQAVNKNGASFANGITGMGVKVAVIDSGIQEHPDLQIAGGVSTVDNTTTYSDVKGHGTHVAGIIAAKNNNAGIVGVAPNVQLYAVKVLPDIGSGNMNDVLEGIQWAMQNDIDIINLSLGSESPLESIRTILEAADKQGILVVAAAGNDGGTKPVNYPAQYSSTIAVSSVNSNKQFSLFSNYGTAIDVAAPGENILSTYLNGQLAWGSGTSQATPHVTGILALLKQQFPNMTNEQLKEALYKRVEDLGPAGYDVKFGHGLVMYSGNLTPPNEVEIPTASEAPKSNTSSNPATAELVKEIKSQAEKEQKQFTVNIKNAETAKKARKDLEKEVNSIEATDMNQVAKVIGQYQAVISYYANTNSYGNVLATVKEATIGLSKNQVDLSVLVETILKPNLSSSSSVNIVIAELKKNKVDTKTIETFQDQIKQAEIGKSILYNYQQKASAFAKRKAYSDVVREISLGVIEATKVKAPNSDILKFVKKNIKSASSVQLIMNEMKKVKLDTMDLENYKQELKKM